MELVFKVLSDSKTSFKDKIGRKAVHIERSNILKP